MSERRYGRIAVNISNEDKVLFPDDGITKKDLVDYFEIVADVMLPHLKDRPLVMQRFPDGIESQGFYAKDVPAYFPEWIDRVEVSKRGGGSIKHVVASNKATLAYLANQGCITMHLWPSRAAAIDSPDQLVFDLDPPGDDFGLVVRTARSLQRLLDELALPAYLKTTGGQGLHVFVPLDGKADFAEVRDFAADVAGVLAARDPDNLTEHVRKNKRGGRLFLDVGRNAYGQHAVAPYSPRPYPGAPVSTPLEWDELHEKLDPASFTIHTVGDRVRSGPDPWSGIYRHKRSLTKPRKRLDRLIADRAAEERSEPE